MHNTRIRVPATAKVGDAFEIRAMIMHPMDNCFCFTSQGDLIPVDIVTDFACRYLSEVAMKIWLEPGISANPYFVFRLIATASGPVDFEWTEAQLGAASCQECHGDPVKMRGGGGGGQGGQPGTADQPVPPAGRPRQTVEAVTAGRPDQGLILLPQAAASRISAASHSAPITSPSMSCFCVIGSSLSTIRHTR